MITLKNVSDAIYLDDVKYVLARDVSVTIPPGRYALLLGEPTLGRYAIDLLAGSRPPMKGQVVCHGLRSWPIGRGGVLYGKLLGGHIVGLIARLYGLDRTLCEVILKGLLTQPDQLDGIVSDWTGLMRREFLYALALLPKFNVHLVEGTLPSQPNRFASLWAPLFGERTLGQTVIMSGIGPPSEFMKYCDMALVFDGGQVFIEPDLENALTRYTFAQQSSESTNRESLDDEEEEVL